MENWNPYTSIDLHDSTADPGVAASSAVNKINSFNKQVSMACNALEVEI